MWPGGKRAEREAKLGKASMPAYAVTIYHVLHRMAYAAPLCRECGHCAQLPRSSWGKLAQRYHPNFALRHLRDHRVIACTRCGSREVSWCLDWPIHAPLAWAEEAAAMCGRFTIKDEPGRYRTNLRLLITPNWQPRYNVCPTQDVPVARPGQGGMDVAMMRWGLIPSWVKSDRQGPPLINARSETIETLPTWRDAFKKRRCLMMGDGYYEWTGAKSPKQPWYISLKSGGPFAFAALWESWKNAKGEQVLSTAMATTTATDSLAFIHDRMPCILTDKTEQDAWLDPATPVDQLKALLRPYDSDQMQAFKVGRAVSNVRNDSPECVLPLKETTA